MASRCCVSYTPSEPWLRLARHAPLGPRPMFQNAWGRHAPREKPDFRTSGLDAVYIYAAEPSLSGYQRSMAEFAIIYSRPSGAAVLLMQRWVRIVPRNSRSAPGRPRAASG